MTTFPVLSCPILDRKTVVSSTPYERDGWSIVQCRETGFVFLANPPDYSQLESEFAWEKTYQQECVRRETVEPIVSKVSSFAKRLKCTINPRRNKIARLANQFLTHQPASEVTTVLDIGCGDGNLLIGVVRESVRQGRKIRPLGIEVSHQLAAISREQLQPYGGDIIMANAIDGAATLPAQSVGLVLMSSFLEHECQPLRLLRSLRATLAPQGAIILKVPNFACWNRKMRRQRWCGFRFPDHVNYFTPKTLRKLAEEAGFAVARQRFTDRSPVSDNMYATLTLK